MEEKTIIESQQLGVEKWKIAMLAISGGLIIIGLIWELIEYDGTSIFRSMGYAITEFWTGEIILEGWFEFIGLILFIITSILIGAISSCSITVTNKRVYGKTMFGKRVDLPIDSISAIAMSAFNGIAVATSSGKINFTQIKNRDEIHKAISDLLIERQNSSNIEVARNTYQSAPTRYENTPTGIVDETEEIKKYKELLDSGIITQEEFDAKKKQIMGL